MPLLSLKAHPPQLNSAYRGLPKPAAGCAKHPAKHGCIYIVKTNF